MKVLIVGGSKGSGVVRGEQLGSAIGATVESRPGRYWGNADVAVLLKHAPLTLTQSAKANGMPLAWDVLDFWRQPDDNALSIAEHIAKVKAVQQSLGISVLIAATKQMASDIGGVYVPHHSRPGLAPTPIRTEAKVVAYEGMPKYLGPWRKEIEYACARLGLVFAINTVSLSEADIVVAFRGEKWDGEVCQRWKSGVKYVNAIAAGRPVLTQHCSAAHEINPFGTIVDHPDQVLAALRGLLPAQSRQLCYEHSLTRAPEFSLETIAAQYRGVVAQAVREVAA